MILITGGPGFVGVNTARALLEIDEDCVLTQHHTTIIPEFLKDQVGKRIFIEPLDVTDFAGLNTLGQKYPISGVIHLVTGWMPRGVSALDLVTDIQATLTGLANVLQAADIWKVRCVSLS